jgi:hypothetical protein
MGEQTDTVQLAPDNASSDQDRGIDWLGGIEATGLNRLFQTPQIDLGKVLAENIVKAALWHTHVKGHLAAFKAVDRNTRTGLLTLYTATGGLALTRTRATANAHTVLGCAFIIANFV